MFNSSISLTEEIPTLYSHFLISALNISNLLDLLSFLESLIPSGKFFYFNLIAAAKTGPAKHSMLSLFISFIFLTNLRSFKIFISFYIFYFLIF